MLFFPTAEETIRRLVHDLANSMSWKDSVGKETLVDTFMTNQIKINKDKENEILTPPMLVLRKLYLIINAAYY